MPNINLISARRAERVRLAQIGKGLFGLTVASAGIGVGLIFFMVGQQFVTQQAIKNQDAELVKLKPVLDEIADAEGKRAQLGPKLETLTQAQARTKRWFALMDGLKHAVPEETWLTNFTSEAAGDAPTLRLNGITSNQARVGETMIRLTAQSEQYQKVDLRYTQTVEREGAKSVEFELSAQLKPLVTPDAAGGTDAPKAK